MTPAVVHGDRLMTGDREAAMARDVVTALHGPEGFLRVQRTDGHSFDFPPELGRIVQYILDVMAGGGSVTVSAIPEELTTTAAAALLGISRPTLMGLIREGRLPAHKVGSHHRLMSADVLAHRMAQRSGERAALEAHRAAEDGLD